MRRSCWARSRLRLESRCFRITPRTPIPSCAWPMWRCTRQKAPDAIGSSSVRRRSVEAGYFDGSPTRARTWDLRINSPSLYQLSYRGFETPTSVSPEKLEGAYSNSPQGTGQRDALKRNRSGPFFKVQTEQMSLGHNGCVDVAARKE